MQDQSTVSKSEIVDKEISMINEKIKTHDQQFIDMRKEMQSSTRWCFIFIVIVFFITYNPHSLTSFLESLSR
jgi:hypothetical protein